MTAGREAGDSRHARTRALFLEARSLPGDQRDAFLSRASADDPALRRDVRMLLEHDAEDDAFLDQPILGRNFVLPGPPADGNRRSRTGAGVDFDEEPRIPARIGPFRILGLLGEGGMSRVYLAEQRLPRRTVALKVLHGDLGSRKSLQRFQLEVEILGRLKHAGIAQVYEAARADLGRGEQLYLAMELVKGPPITRFAREHGLSTRERLELLARTCDALQHAHQRGVIHRDLKPDNVLVDEDGQPKVLDFGVARLLDPLVDGSLEKTHAGELVGTLAYMSPEQVSGSAEEIDVRVDVYGLGLLAYELLAECQAQPLSDLPLSEAVRSILVKEPSPLGEIQRDLRGDVEIIVGKALAKDRDRRYGSPAELAADLRHHLRHEPITARPTTSWDLLKRFTRRRRALVAVLVTLFLVLAGSAITTSSLWLSARGEARRSTLLLDALSEILSSADPMRSGPNARVVDVLREIDSSLTRRMEREPELEAPLRRVLGTLFQKIGDYQAAESNLRRSLFLSLETSGPRDRETLIARVDLANLLAMFLGHPEEAQRLIDEVLRWGPRVLPAHDRSFLEARNLAAFLESEHGDLADAVSDYRALLQDCLNAGIPRSPLALRVQSSLAVALRKSDRLEEAEQLLRDALAGEPTPPGEETRASLLRMYSLAKTLCARALRTSAGGEDLLKEAEALLVRVVEGRTRLLGPDHAGVWNARCQLAISVHQGGRRKQGRELLQALVDSLLADVPIPGEVSEMAGQLQRWYRQDGLEDEAELLGKRLEQSRLPEGDAQTDGDR